MPELVNDLEALINTANLDRVHLVGHDSGAGVAWAAASTLSNRLASLTTLWVPHPAAFAQALATPRQALASWYIYFFQLPSLPERLLIGPNGTATRLSRMLQNSHQATERADRDARIMAGPGAFTAALNWYRALPLTNSRPYFQAISVPTMYVWGDRDTSVLAQGARRCARHVSGDFRFEILYGVSHWIPEEQPGTVADLLLDWFAAHPI
jgi:pimeloyl-ACP methyl ester carboxylesterase